jgi:hypothetical protein
MNSIYNMIWKNELPFNRKEGVRHKPVGLVVLTGHPSFLLSISKQAFPLFIEKIKLLFCFLCSCIMHNNKKGKENESEKDVGKKTVFCVAIYERLQKTSSYNTYMFTFSIYCLLLCTKKKLFVTKKRKELLLK